MKQIELFCDVCPLIFCDPFNKMCAASPEVKMRVTREVIDRESERLELIAEKRIERIDRYADPLRRQFRKYDGRGKWQRQVC